MSVQLSLATGKALPLTQGMTSHYNGVVLKGSIASHTQSSLGEIVLQEYDDEFVSFRKFTINWTKPERFVCEYDHPPGIYSRVALDKSLHEYIKGAGDIYLKKEGFSIITGSTWTGLVSALGPGEHHFIDIVWTNSLLNKLLNTEDPLKQPLQEITNGVPEKFIGPANYLNANMRMALNELMQIDFTQNGSKHLLHNRLSQYFDMMIKETIHFEARKRKMKEMEWYVIHGAKQLIENNLDKQFTTAEISRMIGINEFKLKQLFPKITGYSLDEFRKYKLFVKVGKEMVKRTDTPLKSFYADAGYTNFSNFSKAFMKQCSCTPAELRQDTWDLSALPNYKAEADEE